MRTVHLIPYYEVYINISRLTNSPTRDLGSEMTGLSADTSWMMRLNVIDVTPT